MSLKHFALTALLATLSFVCGGAAKAESRLDDLSHRLLGQLGQLEREYANTFRGGREYAAGLADLRQMTAVAEHFHEAVHHSEPGRHMRADAEKLEQTFHHFESIVGELDRGPRFGRPMHESQMYGSQMFRRLLTDVGVTVHELRELVLQVRHNPRGPAGNGWNGWNQTGANYGGAAGNGLSPTLPAVQTVPMRPGYVVPSVAPVAPALPPYGGYGVPSTPPRSSSFGASLSIRL